MSDDTRTSAAIVPGGDNEMTPPLSDGNAVLCLAAERAERQRNVARAIRVAWSTLHQDGPEVMTVAFARWSAEEGVRRPSDLGGVLRRRYDSAADIAESLRRTVLGGGR